MGDPRLVVAVMQEQSAIRHYQQHGCPALRLPLHLRHGA
jgi:hypothetical protein